MFPLPIELRLPRAIDLETNALENIRNYRREFSLICSLSGLDKLNADMRQRYMYLSIGQPAYTIIEYLKLTLTEEERQCTDTILTRLEHHFLPTIHNILLERHEFNRMFQNEGEKLDHYAGRIWVQAMKCQYKDSMIDDLMRDRFIAGLIDQNLISFLVSINKIMTFKETLEIAENEDRLSSRMPKAVPLYHQENADLMRPPSVPTMRPPNVSTMLLTTSCTENTIEMPLPKIIKEETHTHFIKQEEHSFDDVPMSHTPPTTPEPSMAQQTSHTSQSTVSSTSTSTSSINRDNAQNVEVSTTVVKPPPTVKFEMGAFLVLKTDLPKLGCKGGPPIWKVDSSQLLEKYLPFVEKSERYYKSTAVYNGWSPNSIEQYVKILTKNPRRRLDANQKEITTVQLKNEIKRQSKRKREQLP